MLTLGIHKMMLTLEVVQANNLPARPNGPAPGTGYTTITLQLHYNYTTITLQLHYNYTTITLQLRGVVVTHL